MTNLKDIEDGAFYYTVNGIEEAYFCEVNGVPELVMPELKEVLAPVPSYEEWQSLNELLDSMQDTNKALAHRLNICKKLLEEAKEKFVNLDYAKGLIRRIDEVLK